MRTAIYKNRRYVLEYIGPTKYGRRAKLSFFNGKSTFWVNASLVREEKSAPAPAPKPAPEPACAIGYFGPDGPEPPYDDEFDEHMAADAAEKVFDDAKSALHPFDRYDR